MAKPGASPWDLTALFNAADPKAGIAERHLWVIRLVEWLRHAPIERNEAPTLATFAEIGRASCRERVCYPV